MRKPLRKGREKIAAVAGIEPAIFITTGGYAEHSATTHHCAHAKYGIRTKPVFTSVVPQVSSHIFSAPITRFASRKLILFKASDVSIR